MPHTGMQQENKTQPKDSVARPLPTDSVSLKNKKKNSKKQPFTDKIAYQATDSIIFFGNGTGYMYGQGEIKYQKMDLKADYIRMKMDSSTVYAAGRKDSTGKEIGKPVFKDDSNEFESKELTYNFNSKRGLIHHTATKQGEGYVVSDVTKLTKEKMLCMIDGKYTTCDNHEHPHFYLQMTKAKVKPKSFIVAGPAYLVLEDVPLPIALPFGYFPFNEKYSSGVIMPAYGDDFSRGFYLHNGGYYFALSDYIDLALTGEIYTKGTWAVNAISTYVKRYKYRGNFNFSYRNDVYSEKGMPDYSRSTNMNIVWSHSQDSKASLYTTLSASVNFSTSGYNKSNIDNLYNVQMLSQNTKSSSVNFTQRFPESPFTLSANMNVTQRTQDSTINMQLPNLTVNMSRIYPFKRKNAVGKERWYEKIAMSYSGAFSNSIQTKENKLFSSSLSRDWQNGMNHTIPVSASFNLFNYINISPSLNYHERWYLKEVNQHWDASLNKGAGGVVRDTVSGFYRSYDFNGGISLQTTLYGFFVPNRKIFGDKIDRIRHVFIPSISFSFNPDFSDRMWGSYKTYDKQVEDQKTHDFYKQTVKYSPFEGALYSYPGAGKSGSIGYSFSNNLEMKLKQKSDTTNQPVYKVVSLIDNFTFSGSYNLAADSLRWSNISANLRIKFPGSKNFSLNLSGSFDPYMYGLDANGNPVHINQLRWNHGKFPKFLGTSANQQFTIDNETFSKKKDKNKNKDKDKDNRQQLTPTDPNNPFANQQDSTMFKKQGKRELDNDGYVKPQFKWSVSVNYGLQYGAGTFNKAIMDYNMRVTHSLSLNGTIMPTPKWNINWSGSYSFADKKITQLNVGINRDLHCWGMSLQLAHVGNYTSYMFRIAVKSSLLQDLKYEKRSNYQDNVTWE
jgi:hypothetical protein